MASDNNTCRWYKNKPLNKKTAKAFAKLSRLFKIAESFSIALLAGTLLRVFWGA